MKNFLLATLSCLFLMSACASPCERLARDNCERLGLQSEACLQLKKEAAKAGTKEQALCEQARAMTRRMIPTN